MPPVAPAPLAWYGSSFAYYEPDPPTTEELDAAAEAARTGRLSAFRPEDFGPSPGGGDTTGVVLGRFLPVHDGHRYLIETARSYAARVSVFVRVSDGDPIPWPVRRGWLADLFPDVTVVPVDDGPPDLHQRWTEQIRAHGKPDFVFSGETYGPALAHRLDALHVPVDRRAVPVSGTAVRADPWRWERHLPRCVRTWYLRRVCLIGPESSGKSRLAERLAEHYRTVHVPEFARTLLGDPRSDWAPSMVAPIAKGQQTAQTLLAGRASRLLVCDTDLLAVRLWSERLFDAAPDWVRAASAGGDIDLYLLTAPDLPFVGYASLDRPAERVAFHARCEEELERLGRAWVPVAGSHEERFARAVEAIDALLAQPRP